ncbi:MAG TPA: hypothetical protein ENG66_05185 [Thermococcus sp.]|nr:hypothetical protein [Thermococcus sp.]
MWGYNGLTRDAKGKRTDKTGKRDLTFSKWHRKYLSRKCYATDIDFYEYRINKNGQIIPKAFIEVKKSHVRQKKYLCSANSRAIFHLAKKLGIKFFIILYELKDKELLECEFWVWEVKSGDELDSYSEEQFDKFFKKYSNEELIKLLEGL